MMGVAASLIAPYVLFKLKLENIKLPSVQAKPELS
jgi:hypothetical protein